MSEQTVRVGSLDIAIDARGEGEPLLLLPGLTMRRQMWPEELCDLLAASGHRVIRMDNRDAGRSSRFESEKRPNVLTLMRRAFMGLPVGEVPYRLEDMAEDAFGLMRALGHERFHVAGTSMGGMIAQTMAIIGSERLRSMTSVMSAPGGRRYSVGKLGAFRMLLAPFPRERDAQVNHFTNVFRILNGTELPFDEARARDLAVGQVEAGASTTASARQLAAIIESSPRRRSLLRNVRTPTLVIHGSADPLLPLRGGIATARHVPKAEMLVVRGMGHNLPSAVVPLVAGAIATHARRSAHS